MFVWVSRFYLLLIIIFRQSKNIKLNNLSDVLFDYQIGIILSTFYLIIILFIFQSEF